MDTMDNGNNICLQMTTLKHTHNLSISPDGGVWGCVHFKTAPSLCWHVKFAAQTLKENQNLQWSQSNQLQWLRIIFPAILVYKTIVNFFSTFTFGIPLLVSKINLWQDFGSRV
jgi:hypothetical protein